MEWSLTMALLCSLAALVTAADMISVRVRSATSVHQILCSANENGEALKAGRLPMEGSGAV